MDCITSAVEYTCTLGLPSVGEEPFEEAAIEDRAELGDGVEEVSFVGGESVEGELQQLRPLVVAVFGCCGSNQF